MPFTPYGQRLTPTAAPGAQLQYLNAGLPDLPELAAGGAMNCLASPDQKTLLVLTSGYNQFRDKAGKSQAENSEQYLFIFQIDHHTPERKQVLRVPNTFAGAAFSPDGKSLYVGGGCDDNVHIFHRQSDESWAEAGLPISLGHRKAEEKSGSVEPVTGGLAVTNDGAKLVVANVYNDSVSVIDLTSRQVSEIDLRPGGQSPAQSGVPGGEYPYWIGLKGTATAYVSSLRDREIVKVNLAGTPQIETRIKVPGNPNQIVLEPKQKLLYVTADNSDRLLVIDTETDRVVQVIPTIPTRLATNLRRYKGMSPNALALAPGGNRAYVTDAGSNAVAVIAGLPKAGKCIGLIPTALCPYGIATSPDGRWMYVVSGRSVSGPNPGFFKDKDENQYVEQLQRSSLLSLPVPTPELLESLTRRVAENNGFGRTTGKEDQRLFAELHRRIKHVIYIIKENRTYDQILGDLGKGNGDPGITEFGRAITPNFHQLASQYVDLDNFFDCGDVSADGWPWSTAARESEFGRRAVPLDYSERGTTYDYEGTNRGINVGLATVQQRKAANPDSPDDPNLLPGTADVAALDGPEGTPPEQGYLWNAALRAGLTVRNYGFFCDLSRYSAESSRRIPREHNPAENQLVVAFPAKSELAANCDRYYRGFDTGFPDYWREIEWEREFSQFVKDRKLPSLELVRLGNDHTGSFRDAIDGVNTPELQQSDNDYAVGRLVEKVAHSPFRGDTLIFVIEDDAQAGADHVDSHRSTTYIVGPYVKQGAVVSRFYNTVTLLRTIEDILGLDHLDLFTATQSPMADVFDLAHKDWSFEVKPAEILYNTQLPLPPRKETSNVPRPTHDAAYWADKTAGFDFSREDHLYDPEKYNRIIWEGLKGDVPYPAGESE